MVNTAAHLNWDKNAQVKVRVSTLEEGRVVSLGLEFRHAGEHVEHVLFLPSLEAVKAVNAALTDSLISALLSPESKCSGEWAPLVGGGP